jgi:hypothetical protein
MAAYAAAGEIKVTVDRVALDAVPELWGRSGAGRKLVVVP